MALPVSAVRESAPRLSQVAGTAVFCIDEAPPGVNGKTVIRGEG
ncbi:MAG: hypothetical protein AB2L22_02775 [Syntrophales bacterium]